MNDETMNDETMKRLTINDETINDETMNDETIINLGENLNQKCMNEGICGRRIAPQNLVKIKGKSW